MNRLPIEILVDIFSLLVFKDKLECALTCRDWYAKISSTVLYSKIGFKYTQSDARTKSKIKLLHKRGFGHQILDICIKEIDDPLELAKLCPNLKSLQVNDWFSDDWDDSNNESLARNWGKLETINEARSHNILDPRPRYYLSLKLLDAPLYMMCLTSLTMNLREREDVLPMLTEQLLYAPMLDKLCLEKVPNLDHKRLDLLHKNVLNLKHLELRKINSRFVEDYDFSEDYEFLSMDYSFIVQNLRSISITFSNRYNPELRSHHVEMMVMYWIEYMYHKYTNLSSIAMPDANRTPQQHHRDIMQSYLQRAFCNWSQLEKFDVQPIYFSNKLLQTMDDCNICLKELTVYVDQEEDMDQFINLAYSKQGNNLKKLTIYDNSWQPNEHTDLVIFLKTLKNKNCQLKAFDMPNRVYLSTVDLNSLSPIQLLKYAPTLQRLCMSWAGTREPFFFKSNQMTRLVHLDLRLCQLDNESELNYYTQKHIQDVIDASPLLQSFSLVYDSNIYGITLDLQLTKLEYFNCFAQFRDTIEIIQNNQTKWYVYYPSTVNLHECVLKKEREKKDDICRLTVYLPPTVRSLSVRGNKIPF